jgi:hypothetical protein
MVSGDGWEDVSDSQTVNLTPTHMSFHQQPTVQFPHQIKATATTMDLDRAGYDLIQLHKLYFFVNPQPITTRFECLGFHSFFSFLRNFANSRASSLINVSMVCLFPTLILSILTLERKFWPSRKLEQPLSQKKITA